MKFLLVLTLFTSLKGVAAIPSWFSDYIKSNPSCEREYLCAVGDGETEGLALSEARNEVAKFFQTKVKSKSQVSSSSEQSTASAADGKFDEWTSKLISEETTEIITGLEVKRQEQVDGRTYVLMGLERAKTAKLLKEKIDSLDIENSKAMELNSRFTYPRILKNLSLMDAFRERYDLMSQTPLILKVKKENILEKQNKLRPLKIALVSKGKKLPAKLSHTLIDLLSPLKVVVVAKKTSPQYILQSELITEEQYFKVEGFKKLNVIMRVELLNSKSAVMGKISALSEQVARTNDQAIEKAIPELKESLENNLDQLTTLKMED